MTRLPIHSSPHYNADLLPVRMCNELVYCPRLFHLEHVQGIFVESADTIQGAAQHERREHRHTKKIEGKKSTTVDTSDEEVKGDEEEDEAYAGDPPDALRKACTLSSENWGVRGKMDLVEYNDDEIIVVEQKRGSGPSFEDHHWGEHQLNYAAWPADVAQVGLYMAILRDASMPCDRARIYYRQSRQQVYVEWSSKLEAFLRDVVARAREVADQASIPPPLVDSPKCAGCSLVEVCLPIEHNFLLAESQLCASANSGIDSISSSETDEDEAPQAVLPRIIPGTDEHATVHVLSAGSVVKKRGETLIITTRDGHSTKVLGKDVGHVGLYGPCQITQQCLIYLLQNGVPVTHHSGTGRLLGVSAPLSTRNITLRRSQFRAADDPYKSLEIARAFVISKIRNQITVLRRYRKGASFVENAEDEHLPDWAGGAMDDEKPISSDASFEIGQAIKEMKQRIFGAQRATTIDSLRGYEGDSAARYFQSLPLTLPPAWKNDLCGRSRRPPRDRVNAMLSFGYALLVRDAINALASVGLDPMLGFLHTMIAGRPALALDLMEPFRPAWVDTCVLRLIVTRGITREDFHISSLGVSMSDAGRRSLITAYERRAAEEISHPRFGYRMSYRRMLELEARLLGKFIAGEIPELRPLYTR